MTYPDITVTAKSPLLLQDPIVNAHYGKMTIDTGGFIRISTFGNILIDELIIKDIGAPWLRCDGRDAKTLPSPPGSPDGANGIDGGMGKCLSWGIAGGDSANGATAGAGMKGIAGKNGLNGEDGFNIKITITKVTNPSNIGLTIHVDGGKGADGCNGGNGGTGGKGGNGGQRLTCGLQHCKPGYGGNGGIGGDGGNAGNGGNGGNGGAVVINIPAACTTDFVSNPFAARPGNGGIGGSVGSGGAGGGVNAIGGDKFHPYLEDLHFGSFPGPPGEAPGNNGQPGQSGQKGSITINKV